MNQPLLDEEAAMLIDGVKTHDQQLKMKHKALKYREKVIRRECWDKFLSGLWFVIIQNIPNLGLMITILVAGAQLRSSITYTNNMDTRITALENKIFQMDMLLMDFIREQKVLWEQQKNQWEQQRIQWEQQQNLWEQQRIQWEQQSILWEQNNKRLSSIEESLKAYVGKHTRDEFNNDTRKDETAHSIMNQEPQVLEQQINNDPDHESSQIKLKPSSEDENNLKNGKSSISRKESKDDLLVQEDDDYKSLTVYEKEKSPNLKILPRI